MSLTTRQRLASTLTSTGVTLLLIALIFRGELPATLIQAAHLAAIFTLLTALAMWTLIRRNTDRSNR